MNAAKLVFPLARAALTKLSPQQKRDMLGYAHNLIGAILDGDREVADLVLDEFDSGPELREFIYTDLWGVHEVSHQ